MADALISGERLVIADIFCGVTRRALLGLEPGSQIWLTVEDHPMLFIRTDDTVEPGLTPAAGSLEAFLDATAVGACMLKIDFTERPEDAGRASIRPGSEAWAELPQS